MEKKTTKHNIGESNEVCCQCHKMSEPKYGTEFVRSSLASISTVY